MIGIDEMRKQHSEYIRKQISNLGFRGVPGLLIAGGFAEVGSDGWLQADRSYKRLFEEYLGGRGKLSGTKGKALRKLMDKFGIDYQHSPTHPLKSLKESS